MLHGLDGDLVDVVGDPGPIDHRRNLSPDLLEIRGEWRLAVSRMRSAMVSAVTMLDRAAPVDHDAGLDAGVQQGAKGRP